MMTLRLALLPLMTIALLSTSSTIAQEGTVAASPQAPIITIAESRQSPERTSDLPQARAIDTDFRMSVGDQSAGN